MDNMTYFLLSLPIISLFVERILEIFDLLIVRTIFPLWRSKPVPAPEMIIRLPVELSDQNTSEKPLENKVNQEVGPEENNANDTENKIVHTIGASKLEMKIVTYKQAVECQTQEMELHYKQIIYYLKRYGAYLCWNTKCIPGKDISIWDIPSVVLESRIASLEKIDTLPYTDKTMSVLLNYDPRFSIQEKASLTLTRLEVLADYCYLRNQRTHMVFSLWKQRVYSLLGIAIGILIVNGMFELFQLYQQTQSDPSLFSMINNLSNLYKTSLPFLMQNQIPYVPPLVYITGAGVGLSSQPVHEFLYRGSGSSPVSRPHRITPVVTNDVP
jgi:hypothetical protein